MQQIFRSTSKHKKNSSNCLIKCKNISNEFRRIVFEKTKKSKICLSISFFFVRDTAIVSNIFNSKWKFYDSSRNNSLLNTYNFIVSIKWLINIDFIFCIDQHAMLEYIIKYCFKIEIKSVKFVNFLREIFSFVFSNISMLFMTTKMINKFIVERNWSIQKICYYLLHRKFKHFSRIIKTINVVSIKVYQR